MILKNSENNGTEEIAFVTPTPVWHYKVRLVPTTCDQFISEISMDI